MDGHKMDNKKPLLIFDFYGVVVGEVAHTWLKAHLSPEHAKKIIDEILVAADEGKLTEEELFLRIEQESGVKASAIKEDWFVLGALNHETVNFIKANRDKYHFALLSNAIESYLNQFFTKYQLAGLFDQVFISAAIKLAKPTKAVFDYVLAHFPYPYSKAIMIDDSMHNIKGAKAAGLEGIVFIDMKKTEEELGQILK